MHLFLLLMMLSSYQVGDTARAQIQRIGGLLETVPTTAVCVYADSNYNIFSVYENAKVTAILNPQGQRLVVSVAGKKPYGNSRWLIKREWTTFNKDVSAETYKAIFYKATPVSKSRFYFLADFFFQRGEGTSSNNIQTFVVVDPASNDTAKPIYNLRFHPVYLDSFLYVASGTGVYLGIGDTLSNPPFYHWEWSKLGDLSEPVYDVYVNDVNFVLAGTDSGIYVWDGSGWNPIMSGDITIHGFFFNSNSNNLYAATSKGIYVSSDGGHNWSLYGLQDVDVNVIRFKVDTLSHHDTLFVGTGGEGIYKNPEGSDSFYEFSHGLVDRFYKYIGGLNINEIYLYDSTTYLAGTDCGLFAWFGERWVNIAGNTSSSTLGLNLSTEIIDSAIGLINTDFEQVFEKVTQTFVDSFNVPREEIYPDFDGDPVINVLIAPIHETVDLQQPFYADYLPVIGYFNPADEDTTDTLLTLRDYFVLNVSSQTFRGERFLGIDESLRQKLIAFLLSRMALWQADHDEELFVRTGLAMLTTFWAGYDVSEGLLSGLEFADDFCYSLHQGSFTHATATEMREVDRERIFLFMEYLYEKYGRQIIDTLAKNQRHGYDGLRFFIKLQGDSLEDFFSEWSFANYYDDTMTYGYRNLDIEIHPVAAGSNYSVDYLPPWSVFYLQSTGALAFNGDDNAPFKIFQLSGEGITGPTEQEMDTLTMRFKIPADSVTRVWCLTNVVGNTYTFAFGQDLTPPEPVYVFSIQNSVFNPTMDLYVFGYEDLYTDVELNTPSVTLMNLEDTTESYEIPTLIFATGDSTFIYNGHIAIPGQGLYEVSLIAQDIVGNDAIYDKDTIGVLYLTPAGGTFSFNNGSFTFDYPPDAVGGECYISFDYLSPEYFRILGLKEAEVVCGYALGSDKVLLSKPATISIKLTGNVHAKNVSLFRYSDGKLEPISYSISKAGFLTARVQKLGVFVLATGNVTSLEGKPRLSPLFQRIYSSRVPFEISYYVPTESRVKIEIYDVSGRLAKELFSGNVTPGSHSLPLSLGQLNNGLYFLTLKVDGELICSEKFVVFH